MLSKVIGIIWILLGLFWLIKPESLRKRLSKKMSRKFRFIVYGFILAFSFMIIASVFKAQGILPKIVVILGIIIAIRAILLLTTKTSEKIVDWWSGKPIKYFKIMAGGMIAFGIMIYLA